MLAYVDPTTHEAADTFYPGYAKAMTDIGRERGWPPMTRASFDAQRGPNGALLVTDRIETIVERSGFTGEDQMRTAFVRALGIPHREYRERFASTAC
jgi:AraC-like DNA-binding protein